MLPPRHLVHSAAIQGLGAACGFGVAIVIALWEGPEAQGRYGLLRSAADLLLALALFGLPQSMVHALNQRGASAAALERMSLRYAALLLAAVTAFCLLFAGPGSPLRLPSWLDSGWALLALLTGSVGWTLQGLLRVLTLCRGSAVQFAWFSITPAVTLLAAVLLLLATGSQRFELAIAASGVASVALGLWWLRPLRAKPGWGRGVTLPMRGLLGDGMHAFAQAMALALQPWLTLMLMRAFGASVTEVGHFVFAAYVFQAFGLPANFVAPLLFARISRAVGAGRSFATASILLGALLWTGAAAAALALLLPWMVPWWFGVAYAPAVTACVLLALGGPLLVANRLGVSVLLGRGRFRLASLHAALRLLALPAALLLAWQQGRFGLVNGAALGWLAAEAAGVCVLALIWKWLPLRPVVEGSG